MLTQQFKTRSAVSRTIAWALLVFVFYGTTAEAAHHHARVLEKPSAPSVAQSQNSDSSLLKKTSCNDCLICQLHQNFSATLISLRHNANALGTQITILDSDPVPIGTRVSTPQKGRAPPKVN